MLEKVSKQLNLGDYIRVEDINGGLTNKMYKLITSKGLFAIKIINTDNIKTNPLLLKKIEQSEEIANIALKNGVNAISAIKINNQFIQDIDGIKFLVYKWSDGKVLLTKELNLEHVAKAAIQLARLHHIKVENKPLIKKYPKIDFYKYYELLKNNQEEWSSLFRNNIDYLCTLYDDVYDSYLKINGYYAYAHKDFNRRNILWKNDIPYVIDWETATIDHPMIDFFNSAWFLSNDVQPDKYEVFVQKYLEVMSFEDDTDMAINAAIIDECNWLEFSLKRALKIHSQEQSEIELGKDSITSSLKEIMNYYQKTPLMKQIVKEVQNANR